MTLSKGVRLGASGPGHAIVVVAALVVLAMGTSGAAHARRRPRRRAKRQPAARVVPRLRPAQPSPRARAKALVVQGVAQLQLGDYLKALARFREAYAIYPSPKILFNVAQTLVELGRKVEAMEAYQRFLRRAPRDTARRLLHLARQRVQKLKAELGTLYVDVNEPGASVLIDGREVGLSPMDVPVRLVPGAHLVVVQKKGYLTATAKVTVAAGQRRTHRVVLKEPSRKVVVKRVVYREVHKPRKGWPLFWAGVGVTTALSVAMAVTGGLTLYEQRVLDDPSRSVARRKSAVDRGRALQWATDGLLIAAGATAVFTTVWGLVVVLRSGGVERVPVRASRWRIVPSGAGLSLVGHF